MSSGSASLSSCDTATLLESARRSGGVDAALETEILRRHHGLVRDLGRAYARRDVDRETFEGVAHDALLAAIRAFDQDSGEFVPFATTTIITALRQHLRDASTPAHGPGRGVLVSPTPVPPSA